MRARRPTHRRTDDADRPFGIVTKRRARCCCRAPAKSVLPGLTCGYGSQRPRSSFLSCRSALHLHGANLTRAQVRATWRPVSRRDGPESAPDRSLSTPAFEQVSRLFDDFARALDVAG